MTKFPDWAPPYLVEYYNREKSQASTLPYDKIKLEIALALTTHKDMESTWGTLYQAYQGHQNRYEQMPYTFFLMVVCSFTEAENYAVTKQQKKGERVAQYKDIAKDARLLANKIKNAEAVDLPLMELMSTKAISKLLDAIKPEMASRFCCLINDEINDENDIDRKYSICSVWEYPNNNGKSDIEFIKCYDNTDDFFLMKIAPRHPTLSFALKKFADLADLEAKAEKARFKIATCDDISKLTIFIRVLYPVWMDFFGSPLYGTFAKVCKAVFADDNIDAEQTRTAITGVYKRKPSMEKKRPKKSMGEKRLKK